MVLIYLKWKGNVRFVFNNAYIYQFIICVKL